MSDNIQMPPRFKYGGGAGCGGRVDKAEHAITCGRPDSSCDVPCACWCHDGAPEPPRSNAIAEAVLFLLNEADIVAEQRSENGRWFATDRTARDLAAKVREEYKL